MVTVKMEGVGKSVISEREEMGDLLWLVFSLRVKRRWWPVSRREQLELGYI